MMMVRWRASEGVRWRYIAEGVEGGGGKGRDGGSGRIFLGACGDEARGPVEIDEGGEVVDISEGGGEGEGGDGRGDGYEDGREADAGELVRDKEVPEV